MLMLVRCLRHPKARKLKAYRTIPVHPSQKRLIVVQFPPNKFHLDHCVPFGFAPAAGMQGEPADALINMLAIEKISSLKWVDDLCHRRDPIGRGVDGAFIYAYDLAEIQRRFAALGFPWHKTKFTEFAFEVQYVGFLWNLQGRTFALPETKRPKYAVKICVFLERARGHRVSLKDLYSVFGMLSHVAFVFHDGRSFLPSLSSCAAVFGDSHWQTRYLSHRALSDLVWWADALEQPRPGRSLHPKPLAIDLDIWVDASQAWGVGIMLDGMWDGWRLREGWKAEGRDIKWAEAVGLELAMRALQARGIQDQDAVVHGDNTGSIGVYKKGHGRNPNTNEVVRRMEWIRQACNMVIAPVYVKSEDNLADPISRGHFGSRAKWANFSFELPPELVPFLEHVYLL